MWTHLHYLRPYKSVLAELPPNLGVMARHTGLAHWPDTLARHTGLTWSVTDKQLHVGFAVFHCEDGTCIVDHLMVLLVVHKLENNQPN